MQTNKTIKVITLAGFLLLLSSFIAFRAGVFDRYFEMEKPKVVTTNIDTAALNMAIQKIFPEQKSYYKDNPKVIGLYYIPKEDSHFPYIKRIGTYSHHTGYGQVDERSIMHQYTYVYEIPDYPKQKWSTIDYYGTRIY